MKRWIGICKISPSTRGFKGVNESNIWGLSQSSLTPITVMKLDLKVSCHKLLHQLQDHHFTDPGW
jgi:hypothetical protein